VPLFTWSEIQRQLFIYALWAKRKGRVLIE
jgi:hypothetical protein